MWPIYCRYSYRAVIEPLEDPLTWSWHGACTYCITLLLESPFTHLVMVRRLVPARPWDDPPPRLPEVLHELARLVQHAAVWAHGQSGSPQVGQLLFHY